MSSAQIVGIFPPPVLHSARQVFTLTNCLRVLSSDMMQSHAFSIRIIWWNGGASSSSNIQINVSCARSVWMGIPCEIWRYSFILGKFVGSSVRRWSYLAICSIWHWMTFLRWCCKGNTIIPTWQVNWPTFLCIQFITTSSFFREMRTAKSCCTATGESEIFLERNFVCWIFSFRWPIVDRLWIFSRSGCRENHSMCQNGKCGVVFSLNFL